MISRGGGKEGRWLTGGVLGSPLPGLPTYLAFLLVPERIQSKLSLFLKASLWNGQETIGSEGWLPPREQVLTPPVTSHLSPFLSPEQRARVIDLLVLSPRATGAVLASQASRESRVPEAHRSVPWHDTCLVVFPGDPCPFVLS